MLVHILPVYCAWVKCACCDSRTGVALAVYHPPSLHIVVSEGVAGDGGTQPLVTGHDDY